MSETLKHRARIMPLFQFIPPKVKLATSPTVKYVTRGFSPKHKESFRLVCDMFLREELYSPDGQFQFLWKNPQLMIDNTYISYLSISRKPVAVAFIERGFDFGFIYSGEVEGFLSCYVKPEYRNQGVAKRLCSHVVAAGAFTHVACQMPLKRSVQGIPELKHFICR